MNVGFWLLNICQIPKFSYLVGAHMIEAETCPADSDTTNIMLRETRYFQTLTRKIEIL